MSSGTIDKKIKGLVSALNRAGLPTTGSCEGHVDAHRAPAPWVKITAPREPLRATSKDYTLWQNENAKLRRKASSLLKKFYERRRTSADSRFVIEKAIRGFWIHNGGDDYKKWRKDVRSRAKAISNGKAIAQAHARSPKEAERQKKALIRYQKEIAPLKAFVVK